MKKFDVIIIGAGASGFLCASRALKLGKTVAILEHNALPLKKVKISGGGRCNFTNMNTSKENYLCGERHFVDYALKKFPPSAFISILKKYNLRFSEKAKGQFFCQGSSQEIIDVLLKETQGANIFYNAQIENVEKENDTFKVQTKSEIFEAKSLVVATGGMSYQTIGASDLGYRIAKQFGLKIIPYRPALVPFNIDSEAMKEIIKLKGTTLDCVVTCEKKSFKSSVIFTHFGISGPAILQASLYWNKNTPICIDFLPETNLFDFLKEQRECSKKKKISNLLKQFFSEKFVDFLVEGKDVFISEASNKTLQEIAKKCNNFTFTPVGTQGYKLAEVTAGGVDTSEINSQTFESKKTKGLFFIGEVLDVTGQLGGYNLQWAWSSGYCAAENL